MPLGMLAEAILMTGLNGIFNNLTHLYTLLWYDYNELIIWEVQLWEMHFQKVKLEEVKLGSTLFLFHSIVGKGHSCFLKLKLSQF